MSRVSIIFGIILIIVGGVAYAITAFVSWTALIPAFLGMALVACGVLGFLSQLAGTIVGLVIALAGLGGTFMNVMELGDLIAGTAESPVAIIASSISFVILIAYGVIAIRSLVATARSRRDPARAV